jgi:hypothetical protein
VIAHPLEGELLVEETGVSTTLDVLEVTEAENPKPVLHADDDHVPPRGELRAVVQRILGALVNPTTAMHPNQHGALSVIGRRRPDVEREAVLALALVERLARIDRLRTRWPELAGIDRAIPRSDRNGWLEPQIPERRLGKWKPQEPNYTLFRHHTIRHTESRLGARDLWRTADLVAGARRHSRNQEEHRHPKNQARGSHGTPMARRRPGDSRPGPDSPFSPRGAEKA